MTKAIVVVHYYANTHNVPHFLLSECATVVADSDVISCTINRVMAERECELASGERVLGKWTVKGHIQSVTIIPND